MNEVPNKTSFPSTVEAVVVSFNYLAFLAVRDWPLDPSSKGIVQLQLASGSATPTLPDFSPLVRAYARLVKINPKRLELYVGNGDWDDDTNDPQGPHISLFDNPNLDDPSQEAQVRNLHAARGYLFLGTSSELDVKLWVTGDADLAKYLLNLAKTESGTQKHLTDLIEKEKILEVPRSISFFRRTDAAGLADAGESFGDGESSGFGN